MKTLSLFTAVALIVAATTSCAEEPVQNISPWRHGNLAAAQELTRQAFDKMTSAQLANEYELGGHAARAKELLKQAAAEMKLAAEAANARDR